MTSLSPLVQAFFQDRLINQLRSSPHTIAAYRDTFKMLFEFLSLRLKKTPTQMLLEDLDSGAVGEFLLHLEHSRKNSLRSCNARLAAIRSFFKYLEYRHPDYLGQIQRVLSIGSKRCEKRIVTFLNEEEIQALLSAPDRKTWKGRRDHTLIAIAIQTGLRVSELIALTPEQAHLSNSSHIRCFGKGRKERCTPLTKQSVALLQEWIKEVREAKSNVLFPNGRGKALSRDAVEKLLKKYVKIAKKSCPSIGDKKVSPHTLRHTTAVQLLRAGVDCSLIALYLGHENLETTQIYLKADLTIKEKAISSVLPLNTKFRRFRPDDDLLRFLSNL